MFEEASRKLTTQDIRALDTARGLVARWDLNLSGLAVYTEAATGPYRYTPLVCALAEADPVFAVARDTSFGTADRAMAEVQEAAAQWGLSGRVRFVRAKLSSDVGRADIVMNAGNVRPIDADMVEMMRPTCVVPLMWETWEFRPHELDLEACRAKGVLVMGTDEERMDFRRHTGALFLRMVREAGLEPGDCRFFYNGPPLVARAVSKALRDAGGDMAWTSWSPGASGADAPGFVPPNDEAAVIKALSWCNILAADDRTLTRPVIGPNGMVTTKKLAALGGPKVVLNRSGRVDQDGLEKAGLTVMPPGYFVHGRLGFTTAMLGHKPFMELTVAGLKVAQIMSRARLAGQSPADAAALAMRLTPAQDFPPPLAWTIQRQEQ